MVQVLQFCVGKGKFFSTIIYLWASRIPVGSKSSTDEIIKDIL